MKLDESDIIAVKNVVDTTQPNGLVYFGANPQVPNIHPGVWCKIGEHSALAHPFPAEQESLAGGIGDLLAVSCTSELTLPPIGQLVVLAQHGNYTHIGILRSDRWLKAIEPNQSNRSNFVCFVWVEVLAMTNIASQIPIMQTRYSIGANHVAPQWFMPGGGRRFVSVDELPGEMGTPAELRAELWKHFSLSNSVHLKGYYVADRGARSP